MASDSWQAAWVEVLPDFSNFRRNANSQMSSILGGAGDVGGASASKAMNSGILGGVGKLAVPLAGAFAALGIGQIIGDAVSAGFDYAVQGLDLASNLQQSQGAVEAIFGEASTQVQQFAATSVNDLGLTENAYNELASVLGAQLKNGGTSLDELGGKTQGLIAVGADLSAQFGGSTQGAVEALSSALRGERDPIEKYGVSLNQAAIDAKAAELGFEKVGGALSTQASQAATLAIIMQQTASAQGTFAAESDTLAGQQARLAAGFEEAQTALGTALIPAMTELATFANTTLVPMLNDLIEQIGPVLSEALTASIPAFTELVLALAPLIPDLVKLGAELLPLIVGLLIAISPLLIDWAANTSSLYGVLNALISFLSGDTTFAQFGEYVKTATGSVFDFANGVGAALSDVIWGFVNFVASVVSNISTAIGVIAGFPAAAVAALGNIGTLLISSGRSLMDGFIQGIKSAIGDVGDAVGGVLDFAAGFFPHSPAERGPFSGSGWSGLLKSGQAIGDQFALGLNGSRAPVDMSSLVSVSGITAPRLSADSLTGSGAASTAAGITYAPVINGVEGQSAAEIAAIARNDLAYTLRGK